MGGEGVVRWWLRREIQDDFTCMHGVLVWGWPLHTSPFLSSLPPLSGAATHKEARRVSILPDYDSLDFEMSGNTSVA